MPEVDGEVDVAAIVLAAGKSTRMKSKTPKTLHLACGRPLIVHILKALETAGVGRRVVIVGHQAETVQAKLDETLGSDVLEYALQAEQKGTGHAALMAQPLLANFPGTVLIVPGDTPLLTGAVLTELITAHKASKASATVLTAVLDDAAAYGRIVRGDDGSVLSIVEARDATPEQKAIREINTGVFAFEASDLFTALRDLKPNNTQGELYLTDVLALLREAGRPVGAVVSSDNDIILGVNTRVELAEIAEKMRHRILKNLMLSGVSIEDPATTFVEADVVVGQDTTLLPMTRLSGKTVVGEDCVLGPNANVHDSIIGDGVIAKACFIDTAEVGDGTKIGPFAHIRPKSKLGKKVKIGNFVETKAATLEDGVAAGHLTYLGDATVGAKTNVGAGTITCNYDGFQKHKTTIGSGVFVGSNSILVAPVTVENGSVTAAGSIITESVPADALAIARERQVIKEGWAARRRARVEQGTR